jgi:hypothetical protein
MTHRPDQSLSPQLRQASQNERDELVRFQLRQAADELDDALRAFTFTPSSNHLATLQGMWARGIRTLGNAGTPSRALEPYKP